MQQITAVADSLRRARRRTFTLIAALGLGIALLSPGGAAAAPPAPNFGANVIVLNPSMSQSDIQATLDRISTQQVPNQFGSQRYSIFFEPGTYGSASDPLVFQLGFYTQVAGLGAQPGDVTINGAVDVFNQCDGGACEGTDNFWRSLSNLTLNVHLPSAPPSYAPAPGEEADLDARTQTTCSRSRRLRPCAA